MAERAYITPSVIQWARQTARISVETAADRVSVTSDKIDEWEQGVSQPTIRQAQELAKLYKRPFAMLFLPNIPDDFQPLQDFRKPSSGPLNTASIFIIREIQQKQSWIREMLEENRQPILPFVGRFSLNSSPLEVADDILRTLNINPLSYFLPPLKEWVEKAEDNGIFISRTSFIHSRLKLDSDEIQGFAICDSHAPFIFINSDDWNAPQLFTLVHELAHIWIAASGISNDVVPELSHTQDLNPIELFCNEVAANALLPSSMMGQVPNIVFSKLRHSFSICGKVGC